MILLRQSQPYLKEPALLAVNHALRSETLPIWYGVNDFRVQGSSPAVKFLRSLSEQKLRSLTSLQIYCDVVPTVEYARDRIRKLNRDFDLNGRGLRRQALRFQVSTAGGELVWANLHKLKMLEDAD